MSVAFIAVLALIAGFEDAVLALCGLSDISGLTEYEYDNYRDLYEKPLKLNRTGRTKLLASGLFSSYQTESILDYRSRNGAVLSASELAVVDGFNASSAAALAPFLDFSPSEDNVGGQLEGNAVAGCSFKHGSDGNLWQVQSKLTLGYRGFEASLAARTPWHNPVCLPEDAAYSLNFESDGVLSRVVAGHYHARFAQGLTQWSGGFSSNVYTPSSLMKKAQGIVPYSSFSPTTAMHGLALCLQFGHFSLSPYIDTPSPFTMIKGKESFSRFIRNLPAQSGAGFNTAWNHRDGEVGLTAYFSSGQKAFSLDFQHTVKGVVLYGELSVSDSYGLKNGSTAGVRLAAGNSDIALRLSFSHLEHGAFAALSYLTDNRAHKLEASLQYSYYAEPKGNTPKGGMQLRFPLTYTCTSVSGWTFITRADMRLRNFGNRLRVGLRQDVKLESGNWLANIRAEYRRCVSSAGMAYAEAGYVAEGGRTRLKTYCQTGAFIVDAWDDRISVYQRDAPQTFNMMQLYGRGWWMSVYCSLKLWKHLDIYLRGNLCAYPWARPSDTHRRTTLSAKLQLNLSF